MGKAHSQEYVDNYFKKQGCLLKDIYVNSKTPMRYICSCGNEAKITWERFRIGRRCRKCGIEKCANSQRKDYNLIKQSFEISNCILEETTYINANTSMRYTCSCGRKSKITWANFKKGQRCRKCGTEKQATKRRNEFKIIDDYFTSQKCKLLETEYINNNTPMRYICSCGNESKATWSNFFQGGTRCRNCFNKKRGDTTRNEFKIIDDYFTSQKCKLLETEYINCKTPMRYICSCGRESKITYNNFHSGRRCRQCSTDNRSGEKSYLWNPDREVVELNKKISKKMNSALWKILKSTGKNKENCTSKMIGYTKEMLVAHLKSFDQWIEINKKHHLDHIFPIKAFIEYKIFDPKIICCLENLQPLTPFENISKSDKYNPEEFESWLTSKNIPFESKLEVAI